MIKIPMGRGWMEEIAERLGVITRYYDIWGNEHIATHEQLIAVLKALGVDIESVPEGSVTPDDFEDLVSAGFAEPVIVVTEREGEKSVEFGMPESFDRDGTELGIVLRGEDGKERWFFLPVRDLVKTHEEKGGEARYSMSLPTGISPGYYDLSMQIRSEAGKISGKSLLISPPHRAYIPEKIEKGERLWGVGINLYSLSSEGNLGIGDFGDLEKIIRLVSEEGGDFISINPLHHISNIEPGGVSPYFPLSRLYINPIYIDHRQVPDIDNSESARRFMNSDEFNLMVGKIKAEPLIDYNAVSSLKMQLLRDGFDWFYENEYKVGTHRGDDFRRYVKTEGEPLELHAAFILLNEKFRKEGVDHWRDWGITPGNLKDERVQEFIRRNEKELLFQKYLQWIAEQQIARLRELTWRAGMAVGLLNDLALGVPEMSSEVFARSDLFARGVTVGAPPDDFSPLGQNWGFPPLIPWRLRVDGYGFLRQLFSSNLKRGGGLRVDHVLGFFRMFWIPEGFLPEGGVYVRYKWDEILSVLALESYRAGTLIVGEDLGTVGDEVREALRRFGILSFRLFYFEKDWNTGEFLPPQAYPEWAYTTLNTHDLPTLSGFWEGRDIQMRWDLGRYPGRKEYETALKEREYDRWRLLRALGKEGLLPGGVSEDPQEVKEVKLDLVMSVYRYLGRTPSKLVSVYLDDLLLVKDQQNLPGTINEYPNWKRRLPKTIEEISFSGIFKGLKGLRGKDHHP